MKLMRGIATTTHEDAQGDQWSVEDLGNLVEQASRAYISLDLEHDPRIPPIGRVSSASLVPLSDGAFGVETVYEVWDDDDTPEALRGDGRRIAIDTAVCRPFCVEYDPSFSSQADREFVRDLAGIARTEARPLLKKAVEPVSVLVIALGVFAVFVVKEIAGGFLNELGADLYNALKDKLKTYYSTPSTKERLLTFRWVANGPDGAVEAQAVLTNPDPEAIESVLDAGFVKCIEMASQVLTSEPEVARVVMEWRDAGPHLLFAVRACMKSGGNGY